ncbi:hypothetical protein DFA_02839 [Cavenderia fasciculata]|uniref:Uncharacterized protein n=1 Tax=Cavenderia fasciculata TaxID=261658 RepID=F4PIL6_CACFS|nr:uncharacterized protein DFA_02839 [Cavenderia fasciculata]EGG24596.1 hypothetical protein DFA_02839 [Cavenderia fasciculata]|eukprot:XP_004362447.1 hypothetical protein DFA_02839 [Cavenderia fasciculata]
MNAELPSIETAIIGDDGLTQRSIQVTNKTKFAAIVYASNEGCPFTVNVQDGTITQNINIDNPIDLEPGRQSLLNFPPNSQLIHVQVFIKKGQGSIYMGHRTIKPDMNYRILPRHIVDVESVPHIVFEENFPTPIQQPPFSNPSSFINFLNIYEEEENE